MSASPVGSSPLSVPIDALRWRCPPEAFAFSSTADIEPIPGVIGQDNAVESLRFGLEINAAGQNIFVRGLAGTGRLTLVQRLLKDIRPDRPPAQDRCYVHNFDQPNAPRLISFPLGKGNLFRARIEELAQFIQAELVPSLSSESMRTHRETLEASLKLRLEELSKPFDKEMAEAGLGMVNLRKGEEMHSAIVPVMDGKPLPPETFEALRAEGKIDDEEAARIGEKIAAFVKRLEGLNLSVQKLQVEHRDTLRELYEREARRLLASHVMEIEQCFEAKGVCRFLADIVDDVVGKRLRSLSEEQGNGGLDRRYLVNLVKDQGDDNEVPVIVETTPTLQDLLGYMEPEYLPGGKVRSDHLMIRTGSLLRAEGGYLILDARDLLSEPGAWRALKRTLRTGLLEIVAHEPGAFGGMSLIKPQPIPVNVKVVLLGDPTLYYTLDSQDADFPHLFKCLADFESEIKRDDTGLQFYAGVLARIAREEGLRPFSDGAVAALCEHGARIAGRNDRMTTRFGRLIDLAREAGYLARDNEGAIQAKHVVQAVKNSRRRADLPSRLFRERISEGTVRIQTSGECVGQVNGLAVMAAGPLTFGFPARITTTIGPGTRGMVNVEREANLSGRIHTKGFQILHGLLRHLLRTQHPLVFSSSIAFEQTYGGVDGDSASGAEICCLLSALTEIPLRQSLAMTGAIDQFGNIQPIGGASEKIEGFFDVCQDLGLSGDQGCILPRANLPNLMLRQDVVDACKAGRFHVYAVDTIYEALELFTGIPAGELNDQGEYPTDSLLGRAVDRAAEFWLMARGLMTNGEEETDTDVVPEA